MDKEEKNKKKYGQFEFKTLSFDPNKPRNRADYLKWMSDEEVVGFLDKRRLDFGVLIVNILYDNNAGNIIRSANAFGASEIILYGHKKFDRRSSVGTEFYSHFRHLKYVEDLSLVFKEYDEIVAVENVEGAESLENFEWQKGRKTLLVFGQESSGIPQEVLEGCHKKVQIEQIGSTRSLNVAVAAGVVMYHYCLQTGAFKKFFKC
jgi:tRNA G18 (ribose-2'-O)-methylase SpoU